MDLSFEAIPDLQTRLRLCEWFKFPQGVFTRQFLQNATIKKKRVENVYRKRRKRTLD